MFQWLPAADGGDAATDYAGAPGDNDALRFAAAGFAGPSAGALPAGDFIVRADNVAQQADDRFVVSTTDRSLWFDGNGSGGAVAVLVATFGGAVVPVAGDLTVF